MTQDQIRLVRETWIKILPSRARLAELFYGHLFESHPEVKGYFKGDMNAQGQKLIAIINTAVIRSG